MPTENGSAWATDAQNASTVCPDSVRPLRSVIVTEIMIGSSTPISANVSWIAVIAALELSVSKIVSISRTSTPPSIKARTCSAYASRTWSNVTARRLASSTEGEIDNVRLSGPSDPATNRGRVGSAAVHRSATSRATRAAARLMSRTSPWVP